MFGSHDRRVLCFENGTLFPNCFILPWNSPNCARLKGPETASISLGRVGSMAKDEDREGEEQDAQG